MVSIVIIATHRRHDDTNNNSDNSDNHNNGEGGERDANLTEATPAQCIHHPMVIRLLLLVHCGDASRPPYSTFLPHGDNLGCTGGSVLLGGK